MAITAPGIGSNLDIKGIVSQLMEVEKKPLVALTAKQASTQAKISAFGSLKSALATLQNAVAGMKLPANYNAVDFYSTYKGTLSDDSIAGVTAGEGTVPGKYSLEVTQLAKEHRIASKAGVTIGTGSLTIQLGSEDGTAVSKTTIVKIGSSSLADVQKAINEANAGVTAAVVNGSGGPQLVLTADNGGSKQFIKLSGVSGLDYTPGQASPNFTQQQAAQSALLKLNGIAVESQTNKVSDALKGVTLELKKETAGTPATLTLTRDTSSLNKAVEKMVNAFNDFAKLSKDLGGYNAETRKLGTLGGDASLRAADSSLRTVLGQAAPELASSAIRTLSDIGISMQKDGTLKLDSAKLEKAIATDFVSVAKVAAYAGNAVDSVVKQLIGSDGIITGKTTAIQSSAKALEARQKALENRMTDIEARYMKQYVALDKLVSGMLQTSNQLQQQLASLTKTTSSSS